MHAKLPIYSARASRTSVDDEENEDWLSFGLDAAKFCFWLTLAELFCSSSEVLLITWLVVWIVLIWWSASTEFSEFELGSFSVAGTEASLTLLMVYSLIAWLLWFKSLLAALICSPMIKLKILSQTSSANDSFFLFSSPSSTSYCKDGTSNSTTQL